MARAISAMAFEVRSRIGARRRLFAIDATCPLVTKVHPWPIHHKRGRHIILIGHAGHPEVIGTMGQLPVGPRPWSRRWRISPGSTPPTRTTSPS